MRVPCGEPLSRLALLVLRLRAQRDIYRTKEGWVD
jgi:hypothetical protein